MKFEEFRDGCLIAWLVLTLIAGALLFGLYGWHGLVPLG